MQYSKLIIAVAAFLAGANACKCVAGPPDNAGTEACCAQLGGNFVVDDCRADSISEKLSNFRSCCRQRNPAAGETSDCDYPNKKEKREVKIVEINTAGHIMTLAKF